MTTNDHTVPQMHLRRFARKERKRGHLIRAIPVEHPDEAFVTNVRNVAAVKGFYWGTDEQGVPHHDFEVLLGQAEDAAAPALARVLTPHQGMALPLRWPPAPHDRLVIAWWMAAQLLRTTRQRKRLAHDQPMLPPAAGLSAFVRNNQHLQFLADHLSELAFLVHQRPWAIVFSDACLGTGDVPVVIVNGQDESDQLSSAAFWDVLMPLDPHRLLLLPGQAALQDDAWKRADHRAKLDGGLGSFVTDILYDAADSHIFHHPDHRPLLQMIGKSPRLPARWKGDAGRSGPEYYLSYSPLPPDYNVSARWLREHAQPQTTG